MTESGELRSARRDHIRAVRAASVAIASEPPNLLKAAADRMENDAIAEAPVETMIEILGSGFLVEPGLVVTAYHVIKDWAQGIEDAFHRGMPQPAPLNLVFSIAYYTKEGKVGNTFARTTIVDFSYDEYHDIAVLQAFRGTPPDPRLVIEPLRLAPDKCEEGDDIVLCGYPLGTELFAVHGPSLLGPSFTAAIVSACMPFPAAPREFQHFFRINGWIQAGNSGGPVVNPNTGEVVGVVLDTVRNSYRGSVEGYGRAAHSYWVQRLVENHRTKPPAGKLPKP